MTAYALIQGTLYKSASTRTSSNGNAFTTTTIRYQQKNRDGDTETLFVNVVAFNEQARETLERLCEGDALSAGGPLTIGVWERDGKVHPSLSLIAETCAAARPKPRERKASKPARQKPNPGRSADAGFNDPLLF